MYYIGAVVEAALNPPPVPKNWRNLIEKMSIFQKTLTEKY